MEDDDLKNPLKYINKDLDELSVDMNMLKNNFTNLKASLDKVVITVHGDKDMFNHTSLVRKIQLLEISIDQFSSKLDNMKDEMSMSVENKFYETKRNIDIIIKEFDIFQTSLKELESYIVKFEKTSTSYLEEIQALQDYKDNITKQYDKGIFAVKILGFSTLFGIVIEGVQSFDKISEYFEIFLKLINIIA